MTSRLQKLFITAISTLLMAVMFPLSLSAQFTRAVSGANVYLVTAGPGGDFESWWGHAALVITNAATARDYWYDYGIIQAIKGPGVLRGRLRARVIRSSRPQQMLQRFLNDDRSVRVQQLLLTAPEMTALIAILDSDVRTYGKAGYEYRHITDNCTTRIRDVIDRVSGGALRAVASSTLATQTVREDGYRRFVTRSVLLTTIADVLTGSLIDQRMSDWDAMFLPQQLAADVAKASRSGQPLSVEVQDIPSVHHLLPDHPPVYHLQFALIASAFVVVVLLLANLTRHGNTTARALLGSMVISVALVFGLLGAVLTYAWFATDYTFTKANENILLVNPLLLLTVPGAIAFTIGRTRWSSRLFVMWGVAALLALLALALKAVPSFNQMNWRVIAFVLPVTLSIASSLWIVSHPRRDCA